MLEDDRAVGAVGGDGRSRNTSKPFQGCEGIFKKNESNEIGNVVKEK